MRGKCRFALKGRCQYRTHTGSLCIDTGRGHKDCVYFEQSKAKKRTRKKGR